MISILSFTLLLCCLCSTDGSRLPPKAPQSVKTSLATGMMDSFRAVGQIGVFYLAFNNRHVALAASAASLAKKQRKSNELLFPPDCSDSVSILLNKERGLEVVIIGTAHISEESANVVKRTIRELEPDVVMIELDRKRLGRVIDRNSGQEIPLEDRGFILPTFNQQAYVGPPMTENIMPMKTTTTSTQVSTEGLSATSKQAPLAMPPLPNPVQGFMGGISQSITSLGGQALKQALGQFYKSVEKLGFQAGGEFVAAVKEARALEPPAAVLLGDADVDVTLTNLALALKEYPNTDSFLGLVEKLDSAEKDLGIEISDEMDAASIMSLVDKLKTRSALSKIMGIVKEEAPTIYKAMIGDRDLYMSKSIISVPSDCKTLVAVCGMAHMPGIEENLQKLGGFTLIARKC